MKMKKKVLAALFFSSILLPSVAYGEYGGYSHSLILEKDGNLLGLGSNTHGELGDGSKNSRKNGSAVSTNVSLACAGNQYSVIVKKDGSVLASGIGTQGQNGSKTFTDRLSFQSIEKTTGGALSQIVSLSCTNDHILAVDRNGDVWAWGSNDQGQLLDGTTTKRATASKITLPAGVKAKGVVAGLNYSAILGTNGLVYGGGENSKGQLGTSVQNSTKALVQIQGLTNVASIAGGAETLLALKTDKTVVALGNGTHGQLGDGSINSKAAPSLVKTSGSTHLTNVISLNSSGDHTVAVKGDYSFYAWGKNEYGQLITGDTTTMLYATLMSDGDDAFNKYFGMNFIVGHNFTLMDTPHSGILGWGDNRSGQIGTPLVAEEPLIGSIVLDASGDLIHYDASQIETDPKLSAFTVTPGKLTPSFNSGTKRYKLEVDKNTTTVTIAASPSKPGGHIEVNQIEIKSGESKSIPVSIGSTLQVHVYAPNGMLNSTGYVIDVVETSTQTLTLPMVTPLYKEASESSSIIGYAKASVLQSTISKNGFYQIQSYAGPAWISPHYILQKESKPGRSVRTLELYDAPNVKMAKPAYAKPLVYTSKERVGSWHRISTWLGDKWIYNRDTVQNISKKINLKSITYLKDEVAGPNTTSSLGKQTVLAFEQVGSYYRIKTWLGDKWIYVPTAYESINETIKINSNFELYNQPDSKSGTGKISKPTTLNAIEKVGNWYLVNTWLGYKWVLKS